MYRAINLDDDDAMKTIENKFLNSPQYNFVWNCGAYNFRESKFASSFLKVTALEAFVKQQRGKLGSFRMYFVETVEWFSREA